MYRVFRARYWWVCCTISKMWDSLLTKQFLFYWLTLDDALCTNFTGVYATSTDSKRDPLEMTIDIAIAFNTILIDGMRTIYFLFCHLFTSYFSLPTLFSSLFKCKQFAFLFFTHNFFFFHSRALFFSTTSFRLRIVTANKYLWEEESSGREKIRLQFTVTINFDQIKVEKKSCEKHSFCSISTHSVHFVCSFRCSRWKEKTKRKHLHFFTHKNKPKSERDDYESI